MACFSIYSLTLYLFVWKCHFGCSHSLGVFISRWLCIRRSFVSSLNNLKRFIGVFKKSGYLTYLFPWPAGALHSWKHKTAHFLLRRKFHLLVYFMRTFRGRWTESRGRKKAKQRDVTTHCEMGFKTMWLWIHGLWTNGLKAPWRCLVCFSVAFVQF